MLSETQTFRCMLDEVELPMSTVHIVRRVAGDWPTPAEEESLLPVGRLETMAAALAAGSIAPAANGAYFMLIRPPRDLVQIRDI